MSAWSPHTEPHGNGHAAAHGERRRGLRIRQHRPVKIFEPAGNRYFGGQTEDISSTGLRIELPAFATVPRARRCASTWA